MYNGKYNDEVSLSGFGMHAWELEINSGQDGYLRHLEINSGQDGYLRHGSWKSTVARMDISDIINYIMIDWILKL